MIEEKIIDGREILPPGQHDPQYGNTHQPPFGPALYKDQPQDKEKAYDRSQVARARSSLRLRTPVYRAAGILQGALLGHAKGLRQFLRKFRIFADFLPVVATTRRARHDQ